MPILVLLGICLFGILLSKGILAAAAFLVSFALLIFGVSCLSMGGKVLFSDKRLYERNRRILLEVAQLNAAARKNTLTESAYQRLRSLEEEGFVRTGLTYQYAGNRLVPHVSMTDHTLMEPFGR